MRTRAAQGVRRIILPKSDTDFRTQAELAAANDEERHADETYGEGEEPRAR